VSGVVDQLLFSGTFGPIILCLSDASAEESSGAGADRGCALQSSDPLLLLGKQ
jgi:hypothetical protein